MKLIIKDEVQEERILEISLQRNSNVAEIVGHVQICYNGIPVAVINEDGEIERILFAQSNGALLKRRGVNLQYNLEYLVDRF